MKQKIKNKTIYNNRILRKKNISLKPHNSKNIFITNQPLTQIKKIHKKKYTIPKIHNQYNKIIKNIKKNKIFI
jgi:hypothetical protein